MFGSNTYWWAGLLIFILFISLNVVIWLLRKKPQLSYAIAYSIALFLLVYKIGEYAYWQAIGEHLKFPVELSAVGYFLFGISVTFRIKKLDQLGVFLAVIAGFVYSMAFWVSPDSYVSDMETPFLFAMAITNHHLMYLGGMLMLANVRRFYARDFWQLLTGVGVLVGYSWIIYLFTDYAKLYGKPLIIQMTDGSILTWLFGGEQSPLWQIILYFIFAFTLFTLIIVGFYKLNKRLARRRGINNVPQDYFPPNLKSIYKF